MKNFDFFSFYSGQRELASNESLVCLLSDINSKSELMKFMADGLQFPGYFGHNWDALEECLRDLSWIENCGVTVIHKTLPNLSEGELYTYLDILWDSTLFWRNKSEHYLQISFPISARSGIETWRMQRDIPLPSS